MTNLLIVRDMMKRIYGKYEAFITPTLKFFLAVIALCMVNGSLGFMERIDNILLVIMVALLCSFLPMGFIIFFSALFVTLHLYALGIEVALIALCIFLIMFVLFFRFSPKDSIIVVLTPILFVLKIPYIIPLSMGLVSTPISVVSVGCGVVVYYFLHYVSVNAVALKAMEDTEMMARIRLVIDSVINNKAMLVTLVAFAVTIVIVYTVRRLSIDHSWTIAMAAGTILNIVVLMIGDLILDTNESIVWMIVGSALSFAITKVLQFLIFNVDYSRTERVQFEDDEYYYYVKAVPKINVAAPEKTVKQINKRTKEPNFDGKNQIKGRNTSERSVTVEHIEARPKDQYHRENIRNQRAKDEDIMDFDNL